MDKFNRILLLTHVVAGLLALAIAFGPMLARKGEMWHVWAGRIYFWAMMWVMVSAVFFRVRRNSFSSSSG